ncbi:hypothetical protein [Streptomyces sp. C10-9-1]
MTIAPETPLNLRAVAPAERSMRLAEAALRTVLDLVDLSGVSA